MMEKVADSLCSGGRPRRDADVPDERAGPRRSKLIQVVSANPVDLMVGVKSDR